MAPPSKRTATPPSTGEDFYHFKEVQGRRGEMEDAHVVHCGPPRRQATEPCLFGVFDGHGGSECAQFCAANLCSQLSKHVNFYDDPELALIETFSKIDSQYAELSKQLDLDDGSTGTVLLLHLINDKLRYYVAAIGDSRPVIVHSDGNALPLVEDHNPSRLDERDRIAQAGGEVLYDPFNQIYRVSSAGGGGLAVTRAFGDFAFKPYVTAVPEVVHGTCDPERDAYIVLASDGLWGDLQNTEVGRMCVELGGARAVEHLADEAYARGSDDNITVIVVDLKLAREKLRRWDVAKNPPPRRYSLASLASENINTTNNGEGENLPDGGGGEDDDEDDDANIISRFARKLSSVASGTKRGMRGSMSDKHLMRRSVTGGNDDDDDEHEDHHSANNGHTDFIHGEHDGNDGENDDLVEEEGEDGLVTLRPRRGRKRSGARTLKTDVLNNQMVQWTNPLITLAWFTVIQFLYVMTLLYDYPLVVLLSLGVLARLLLGFTVYRLADALSVMGFAGLKESMMRAVAKGTTRNRDAVAQFSEVLVDSFLWNAHQWRELVTDASIARVLVVMRTLTYLLIPVSLPVISWLAFTFLFTFPAIYSRNKSQMDATWKIIKELARPYVDAVKLNFNRFKSRVPLPTVLTSPPQTARKTPQPAAPLSKTSSSGSVGKGKTKQTTQQQQQHRLIHASMSDAL